MTGREDRLTVLGLWGNGFDLDRGGCGVKGCGYLGDLTGHRSQRFPFHRQTSSVAIVSASTAVLPIPGRGDR